MKITEILSADMVVPEVEGTTKPQVLRELARPLATKYRELDPAAISAVLAERERLGSTAIGDGIAIPHGKIASVKQILGTFGRHRHGVDFESLDGRPTHLFFVLVAPEDSTSLHLKALARVSRLFKDGSFRERLMTAKDAEEIFRLIVEEDARY
ncbi:MAG: PTS sugar transporter subunit IIA [Deltaproteobacteria bacterium]|nr:PTS sugar transporter subunit IIA [Deltaproteobacteria bacterium]MBV8450689.1 PTS sugar transporter subunit IIA [Deltaproteobacteria bacterium]